MAAGRSIAAGIGRQSSSPSITPVRSLAVAACATGAAAAAAVLYTAGEAAECNASSGALGVELKKMTIQMAADTNNDGKLSAKEIEELFMKLDANKDGQVSFDEWRNFLVKSGLGESECAHLETIFKELDKDNSGTISIDEFRDHFHPDYAARYARGVVVAFLTKGRFIAYTSDIGESARPVMPKWFVNGCYGLTFLYVAVAVGHHTQEANSAGASQSMVLRAFSHSATFELLASVAMPSLIIHQAVHFAQHHAHRLPAGPVARWAPTVVGLCCIPFLPYLDPPAEVAIDAAFDYAWPDDGTLPPKAAH